MNGLAYLYVAGFLALGIYWLWVDTAPPAWDPAGYIWQNLRGLHLAQEHGVGVLLARFIGLPDRSPLVNFVGIPALWISGPRADAAAVMSHVAACGCLVATYVAARIRAGASAALFAVMLLGALPLYFGLSRQLYAEVFVMTCTAIATTLVVAPAAARDRRGQLAFGAVVGVGMLFKVTMVLPVAALIATLSLNARARAVGHSELRLALLRILGVAAFIAVPWYAMNAPHIVSWVLEHGYGDTAARYGFGSGGADSWLAGLGVGISSILSLPGLVLVSLMAFARATRTAASGAGRDWMYVVFAISAAPVLFSPNRDVRLVAPWLPVLALWCAEVLSGETRRWLRYCAVVLVVALNLNMLRVTFDPKVPGLDSIDTNYWYARAPRTERWPLEEIVHSAARGSLAAQQRVVGVAVGTEHCSANVLRFVAEAERLQLRFADLAAMPATPSTEAFLKAAGDVDSILIGASATDGEHTPANFNALRREIIQRLSAGATAGGREIRRWQLPDGSELQLIPR